MLTPVRSSQFKRDVKRAVKRGKDLQKLKSLLGLLVAQAPLPEEYQDHPLRGNWKGYRDAHIEPDWLLLYCVEGDELHLARTGSHSDLFQD
ncbi:mRNA interferase YafQ [Chromohalobacter marismortui]|uniref:mRNA interferase YafQ n=1 Tax=Chromohalobacter marismortui TaxID=42055 RepID=A0A4R7NVD1_9GAMM|nr:MULTISPECIES: type II toxin-antitoxin system YafQ family toxin [Chromohalobacter]MCI0510303.1 type II toxin-antitoxin system YafQ family toxin [Chromohalobacter sp.]MCI0593998.1 type II toxin-antitoxin system YafQ family toxin [Chromohalobacter sp.]TDU25123.1 mRNA interferase YafQ [Chromohalobacter marismortui]